MKTFTASGTRGKYNDTSEISVTMSRRGVHISITEGAFQPARITLSPDKAVRLALEIFRKAMSV